jgi:uncharacterized membrane protein YGL010W
MTIKRGLRRLCIVISVLSVGMIVIAASNSAWEGVQLGVFSLTICWVIYWLVSGFFEDEKNDNESDREI